MEWIEVTGKTVEEAIDAALDELGVDESDIEYEVLDSPKRGFFGLGGAGARIRARVKPISREKPDRRRRSGPRADGGGRGGQGRGRPGGSTADRTASRPARPPVETDTPTDAPRGAVTDPVSSGVSWEAAGSATSPESPGPGMSQEGSGAAKRSRQRRRGARRAPGTTGATTATSPRGGEEAAVSGSDVSLED